MGSGKKKIGDKDPMKGEGGQTRGIYQKRNIEDLGAIIRGTGTATHSGGGGKITRWERGGRGGGGKV